MRVFRLLEVFIKRAETPKSQSITFPLAIMTRVNFSSVISSLQAFMRVLYQPTIFASPLRCHTPAVAQVSTVESSIASFSFLTPYHPCVPLSFIHLSYHKYYQRQFYPRARRFSIAHSQFIAASHACSKSTVADSQ